MHTLFDTSTCNIYPSPFSFSTIDIVRVNQPHTKSTKIYTFHIHTKCRRCPHARCKRRVVYAYTIPVYRRCIIYIVMCTPSHTPTYPPHTPKHTHIPRHHSGHSSATTPVILPPPLVAHTPCAVAGTPPNNSMPHLSHHRPRSQLPHTPHSDVAQMRSPAGSPCCAECSLGSA